MVKRKRQLTLQQKWEKFWDVQVQKRATKSWNHFSKYFLSRNRHAKDERRFVALWISLLSVIVIGMFVQSMGLGRAFTEEAPSDGGLWRDGMIGQIENLNPIFASSDVDKAAGTVLFDSLLKFENNRLSLSLAKSLDTSEDGLTKTIKLRDGVRWHDGKPLTSKDVVYTIKTVQDPVTGSPLSSGLRGIKVSAPDDSTVKIKLPAVFASFDYALTIPILPSHLLSSVSNDQLRSDEFNSNPIGSGPFVFHSSNERAGTQTIDFTRNKDYFAGKTYLKALSIIGYEDASELKKSFESKYLTSAVLPTPDLVEKSDNESVKFENIPLDKIAYVFLKNSSSIFSDKAVRQAFALGTNQEQVVRVSNSGGIALRTPLLPGQIGYSADEKFKTNVDQASKILTKSGWKLKSDNTRYKKGKPLAFDLVINNSETYRKTAQELARQWRSLGANVRVKEVDTKQFQKMVLNPHNFDALLYSLSVGPDSDEYVFWHSSQAEPGKLNFAEYRSMYIDNLLDGGRTKLDSQLRSKKYQAFSRQFINDVPAITLYRLTYSMAYHEPVSGLSMGPQPDINNRYSTILDWSQRQRSVLQTP